LLQSLATDEGEAQRCGRFRTPFDAQAFSIFVAQFPPS
jgi:hypothetical protein